MFKKEHLFFILLLAVLVFSIYYDSFNNSFIWDDHAFIEENPSIRKLDMRHIASFFSDKNATSSNERLSGDVWRPLTILSFAVDYKFWKLNPRYYHIENTIFHILNAILVYILMVLICENITAAFIAALVFGIHPVQTEAVTWISGRANVLFLFFGLSSFLCHIKNRINRTGVFWYSLSVIFFTLGLLSKEMAIILPLILILYDIHFYSLPKKRSNYYAPFFLISFSYIVARFSVLGRFAQRDTWWGESMLYNILTVFKAVAGYLRLLVFPANLRTGYLVDISKSIGEKDAILAIMVLSLVIFLYIWKFRNKKVMSFYILWFFVTLIPVSNIIPFKTIMAERFLYLPSIAFAAIFGILFSKIIEKFKSNIILRSITMFILAAILIFYGLATITRNIEWRNELIFGLKEVARSPSNPRCHYNLGLAYMKEAEKNSHSKDMSDSYYALAIKEFNETTKLMPDHQLAYINSGDVYNRLGLYNLAIENFKHAISIEENYAAYNNLAIAYYNNQMYDKTIKSCRRSLGLKPDHMDAYINLGNAYFMKSEYRKAKMAWSRATVLGDPGADIKEFMKYLERMGY